MPPRQYLTTAQKMAMYICMLKAGETQNHDARLFEKSKSVIARLAAQHHQTGDVKMMRDRGRHR